MQLKRLGVSCDWSRERFTMDDGLSRAVREVFDGWQTAGRHELAWDGRNNAGARAAAGIYVVRAEAEGRRRLRKYSIGDNLPAAIS